MSVQMTSETVAQKDPQTVPLQPLAGVNAEFVCGVHTLANPARPKTTTLIPR